MRRNIARDLAALALAILGSLATIALAGLLAWRGDWLGLGLLVGGTLAIGLGLRLGRYDPDAPRRAARPEEHPDGIVMVPRVREGGNSPTP